MHKLARMAEWQASSLLRSRMAEVRDEGRSSRIIRHSGRVRKRHSTSCCMTSTQELWTADTRDDGRDLVSANVAYEERDLLTGAKRSSLNHAYYSLA